MALLTLQEIASYLRVTEKTMHRMLRRRAIPASKVGHQWRFDKAAIDEWLRARSVTLTASILVIDDDELIRTLFQDTLAGQGYEVVTVGTASAGLEAVKQKDFDLVFLDLKLPVTNGAELLGKLRAVRPDLPVTLITGYPDSEIMSRALSQGPMGIMSKPFNSSEILTAVNNYVRFGKVTK